MALLSHLTVTLRIANFKTFQSRLNHSDGQRILIESIGESYVFLLSNRRGLSLDYLENYVLE